MFVALWNGHQRFWRNPYSTILSSKEKLNPRKLDTHSLAAQQRWVSGATMYNEMCWVVFNDTVQYEVVYCPPQLLNFSVNTFLHN